LTDKPEEPPGHGLPCPKLKDPGQKTVTGSFLLEYMRVHHHRFLLLSASFQQLCGYRLKKFTGAM
jgi:hypothetical protein